MDHNLPEENTFGNSFAHTRVSVRPHAQTTLHICVIYNTRKQNVDENQRRAERVKANYGSARYTANPPA